MSTPGEAIPPVLRVREVHDPSVPALVHQGWRASFPWLVQGTTTRGTPSRPFDLGLFAEGAPATSVHESWGRLLATTAMPAAAHARQVHEAQVRVHESAGPGLQICDPCDGHVTDQAGVLLAVTTADCVPVFVVAPESRTVAVLHAGWRGAAAGVLERGLETVLGRSGSDARELHIHLGPAICGKCYEVGPEVFTALGQPAPTAPEPIDLRRVLVARTLASGADPARVSVSEHCTRCTRSGLFSHRGGDRGRQVGYLGIRG